jgi:hypothetical protein
MSHMAFSATSRTVISRLNVEQVFSCIFDVPEDHVARHETMGASEAPTRSFPTQRAKLMV